MKIYNVEKSLKMYEEANKYIVGGVVSGAQRTRDKERPMIYMSRGKGSKVYDIDGNEYIDYLMGYGPMIQGYVNEDLNEAMINQLSYGTHFATATEITLELAKKICEIIPSAEKVLFQSSGTEANEVALRFARAYTGKEMVIKIEGQYHGWSDEQKITVDAVYGEDLGPRDNVRKIYHERGQKSSSGDKIRLISWNDIDVLEKVLSENDDIAAIIMEPMMYDSGPIAPRKGYLEAVRRLTKEYGVVLIFDEVVTGFRMSLGGAQEYFGVTPDMSVFGKALAGGTPIAAVVGKREIMETGNNSGTFSGNPLSAAMAVKNLNLLQTEEPYPKMQSIGSKLINGIVSIAREHGYEAFGKAYSGLGMYVLGSNEEIYDYREYLKKADRNAYYQMAIWSMRYGIKLHPSFGKYYLSTKHTEADIDKTLEVIDFVFDNHM